VPQMSHCGSAPAPGEPCRLQTLRIPRIAKCIYIDLLLLYHKTRGASSCGHDGETLRKTRKQADLVTSGRSPDLPLTFQLKIGTPVADSLRNVQ